MPSRAPALAFLLASVAGSDPALAAEPSRPADPSPGMPAHEALSLAGGAALVLGYVGPIVGLTYAGFPNGSGFMLVPLGGPWLTLAARDPAPSPFEEHELFAIWTSGVLQAAGITLLVAGSIANPNKEPIRLNLGPAIGPGGQPGLRLGGTF